MFKEKVLFFKYSGIPEWIDIFTRMSTYSSNTLFNYCTVLCITCLPFIELIWQGVGYLQ